MLIGLGMEIDTYTRPAPNPCFTPCWVSEFVGVEIEEFDDARLAVAGNILGLAYADRLGTRSFNLIEPRGRNRLFL